MGTDLSERGWMENGRVTRCQKGLYSNAHGDCDLSTILSLIYWQCV